MKPSVFLYITATLGLLLTPLLLTNTQADQVSEIDNRSLTEWSGLSNLEAWLKDRIGLRSEMLLYYSVANNALFDQLEHPLYTNGKDGYVFADMHDNIQFGDFHQSFVSMVSKVNQYCQERGIQFYFVFDPEKQSIYREYLPEGVEYNDQWVDALCQKLEEEGVTVINNTSLLQEKAKTEQVFNIQYDANHWNALGAFYGLNHVLETMAKDFPAIQPFNQDDFLITQETAVTLLNSEFPIEETIPVYTAYPAAQDITELYEPEVQRDSRYPYFHVYKNPEKEEDLPVTLIFQGSYINNYPQFLWHGSQEEIGIHNYQNIFDIEEYINLFEPDAVILDAAEYVFYDNYFGQEKMESFHLNPALDPDLQPERYNQELTLKRSTGRAFTWLEITIPHAKSAWLKTPERTYDFQEEGDTFRLHMKASAADHSSFELVWQDDSGIYFSQELQTQDQPFYPSRLSPGTKKSGDEYTFTTTMDGNEFDYVGIQICSDTVEPFYLNTMEAAGSTGPQSYMHTLPTGIYEVRLRANSSKQDEFAMAMVHLEEGKTYQYSWNTEEFTPTRIFITDFQFSLPGTS